MKRRLTPSLLDAALEGRELLSAGPLRANTLTYLDTGYLIQPGGFYLYGVKASTVVYATNEAAHVKSMTAAPAAQTPFQVWAAAHPWAARRALWAARHR